MINTGSPQGCCISPFLFSVYTNDLQSNSEKVKIIKFADDTAIAGLITDDDIADYTTTINQVNSWSEANYLRLNASKTKEIIYDCRKRKGCNIPVFINNSYIEMVTSHKYLGVVLDNSLTFSEHIQTICSKVCSRLYILRQLNQLGANSDLKTAYYRTNIESILMYSAIIFYPYLTAKIRREWFRPYKIALKLGINKVVPPLDSLVKKYICNLSRNIISNETHPLHDCYKMLPRSKKISIPYCRNNKFINSFVINSSLIFNSN